jgi:choline dehydrogenase-like flavoprotein
MRYDVIIVGAGSAGCVLAARLSEASSRSVLLLEAGPDYHDAPLPPEIANGFSPAFTHDWGYVHEPDQLGRTIHLPRAKLVGGCSATNATFALRGTPGDYDEWAAQGNPSWAFADLLPFFRSLENDVDIYSEWHGTTGPLPIRRSSREELTAVQRAFLQACAEVGYAQVADHNAPGAIGAGLLPMNTISGVRQSTAQTYLAQARSRPNLTVRGLALVDRLLFEGRRAVGVRLALSEETIWADTILLSAGTYNSPMILMRSGLGPAQHLQELDIPVLEDLPGVGANLMDHPLLGMRFAAPLSACAEGHPAFQTLLTLKSEDAIADHDLHIFPHSIFPCYPEESESRAQFALLIAVMRPHSRGRLRLRSSAPDAPPAIDLGYFTDPRDMRRMLKGVRVARQVAQTAAMRELALQELYPGTELPETDANLEAAVLAEVESYHHPVGTCRMGPATDSMAVVDPQGKVQGVKGLWVVDASIMPTIPAANTNLPTILVAERCAAWLTSLPTNGCWSTS